MRILVLGSGGREHAIAWKIKQSPTCKALFIAPGNPGTDGLGQNVPLDIHDAAAVRRLILAQDIDLLVVGPEAPLVNGLTDELRKDPRLSSLSVVGPGAAGARLEGSKEYAKRFMHRYGIPTAKARVFREDNLQEGRQFLDETEAPYVLKADGLAAGKGVIITHDVKQAKTTLEDMLVGQRFGQAGSKVLIEQFLSGVELSVFILTDGKNYILLPEAKDYKRIGEGDTGPNTGGMGAVSPVTFADNAFWQKTENRIIKPTLAGLQKEGIAYRGFLFFGLMNVAGDPYVIEYNVRLGDPEAEAILPRIQSDFLTLLRLTAEGKIGHTKTEAAPEAAVTLMMVSEGYPGAYQKGRKITFERDIKNAILFHAGTKKENGQLLTNGGRVMCLTGLGKSMSEALGKAYKAAGLVHWQGKNMRNDIGRDLQHDP